MANLFIDIEARFAKFQDSLDQIKRQAEGFTKGLERSFGGLKSIFAGLGAALGVRELVNQFQQTVNAADELEKVAQKTGISVSALSELKFAAEINNLSFEDLQIGLKNLAVAIDTADKSFARLDLDPKKFKSLDQAVLAIADRFSKMDDAIKTASISKELFGKSGINFVPFLRLGNSGITEFTEEFRKLGGVVGPEFAKNADQFNDNLKKMVTNFQGVKNSIIEDMLPPMNRMLEVFLAARKAETGVGISIVQAIRFGREKDANNLGQEIIAIEEKLAENKRLMDAFQDGGKIVFADDISMLKTGRNLLEQDLATLKQIQNDKFLSLSKEDAPKRKPFLAGENESAKPKKSKADTSFESLRSSLLSQLTSERKLTEELTLIEDERFKKLSTGQRSQLISIAQRIDVLRKDKTDTELIEKTAKIAEDVRKESLNSEIDSINRRKIEIENSYKDNAISATQYYSLIAAEDIKSTDLQLAHLQELQEAQRNLASDITRKPEDRIQSSVEIEKIQNKINALVLDQRNIEVSAARDIVKANEEILTTKVRLAQQLNELRGRPDAELDKLALKDQFKDLPQEIQQSVTFQVLIDTQVATRQLDQFERIAHTRLSTLREQEQSISLDQSSGRISSDEATHNITKARKETLEILKSQVTKIEELRAANVAAFGPEQEARLLSLKNSMESLNQSTDTFLITTKQVGEGPLTNFFQDILSGTKSASDAFKNFADSVLKNLNRIAAEQLTQQIFGGLKSSGLSDFAGSLFSQKQSSQLDSGSTNLFSGAQSGVTDIAGQAASSAASSGLAELAASTVLANSALSSIGAESVVVGPGLSALSAESIKSTASFAALSPVLTTTTNQAAQMIFGFKLFETALGELTSAIIAARIQLGASAAGTGAAKGGVFSGGVQAFASGGIVNRPTTFQMYHGRGLMGEAGPEAILPVMSVGGGYNIRVVNPSSGMTTLSLGRDHAGRMGVVAPAEPKVGIVSPTQINHEIVAPTQSSMGVVAPQQFQYGGVLAGTHTMRFEDGGVLVAPSASLFTYITDSVKTSSTHDSAKDSSKNYGTQDIAKYISKYSKNESLKDSSKDSSAEYVSKDSTKEAYGSKNYSNYISIDDAKRRIESSLSDTIKIDALKIEQRDDNYSEVLRAKDIYSDVSSSHISDLLKSSDSLKSADVLKSAALLKSADILKSSDVLKSVDRIKSVDQLKSLDQTKVVAENSESVKASSVEALNRSNYESLRDAVYKNSEDAQSQSLESIVLKSNVLNEKSKSLESLSKIASSIAQYKSISTDVDSTKNVAKEAERLIEYSKAWSSELDSVHDSDSYRDSHGVSSKYLVSAINSSSVYDKNSEILKAISSNDSESSKAQESAWSTSLDKYRLSEEIYRFDDSVKLREQAQRESILLSEKEYKAKSSNDETRSLSTDVSNTMLQDYIKAMESAKYQSFDSTEISKASIVDSLKEKESLRAESTKVEIDRLTADYLNSKKTSLSDIHRSGGIMTSLGPLRKYAQGGVANSPQLAMFGEGSRPEAFVPLPDGKSIPVQLSGEQGMTLPITFNISTPDVGGFRKSRNQIMSEIGVAIDHVRSRY